MELREIAERPSLSDQVDQLTARVTEALRTGDLYNLAAWRLERALVEMQLRDLWGPWSPQGGRWDAWMQDDISQARKTAAQLAARIGDSGLVERLLYPHPEWFRLVVLG